MCSRHNLTVHDCNHKEYGCKCPPDYLSHYVLNCLVSIFPC
jgi:hypothetical protein